MYDLILIVIASRNTIYDQFVYYYWIHFIKYVNKYYSNKIKIFLSYDNCDITDFNDIKDNILYYELENTDKYKNNIFGYPNNYIPNILQKTINSFKYVNLNYNYKYVLRTNLSSFFILENLIKIYEKLPEKNLFGGINKTRCITTGYPFVNGSALWFSKDIIDYIITNENKLKYEYIDDVAISILLNEHVKSYIFPRYDIVNITNNIKNKKKLLNIIKQRKHYHIRLKIDKNRDLDIENAKEFTKILYINNEVNNGNNTIVNYRRTNKLFKMSFSY